MEANDMKTMREALLALKELDFNKEEDCHAFYRIIDEALAKPPRQCDVGTPEEQNKRLCSNFFFSVRQCGSFTRTALEWAQTPYPTRKEARSDITRT